MNRFGVGGNDMVGFLFLVIIFVFIASGLLFFCLKNPRKVSYWICIIVSTMAFIAGSCKQATNKQKQAENRHKTIVNQSSLEEVIIETIKAYQNQDEAALNKLVMKDFGIAFMYRRGTIDNLSIADKISFDTPVPEYLPYDIYFETDYKIRFETLPVYSCESEEWDKSHGIYCDTTSIDKKLSITAKNENKWIDADWSADEIKKFEEIEMKSHKIIITGKEYGSFIFYLTFWQNKWYLTVIDRFEVCSA